MNIFKKDARKNFIIGVMWILLLALMIAIVIVDINAGHLGLAILAMFAGSCDGINAFIYFRNWWYYRQTYKILKEDKNRLDTE